MASNLSPEDPYFWTVDQLTYELCHNPQPVWSSQAKRALMPTSDVFENAIRENVLDGESFMSMDITDITNELGVSAFGIRRNIFKIVKFLRAISVEYGRQNIVDQVMPHSYGVESPQITASHLSGRPQSVTYGNQTPLREQHSPRLPNPFPSTPAQWPGFTPYGGTVDQGLNRPMPGEEHPAQERHKLHDVAEDSGFQEPSPGAELIPEVEPSLATRTGNHTFERSSSKQRQDVEVIRSGKDLEKTRPDAELDKVPVPKPNASFKTRERLAPTFMSHIPRDRAGNPNRSEHVAVQDIFTKYIGPEYEFVLTKSIETAEARKGAACITKMLLLRSGSAQRVDRKGSRSQEHRAHKDIVVNTQPIASVEQDENPFLVPEQQPPEQGEVRTTPTRADLPYDLARLLDKYPPVEGDDGYAIFGDSGDEGEYDEETWVEIQAEIEESRDRVVSAGTLTSAAVNAAIDEAIAEMIVEWNTQKLPKTQAKGYRMWNKATRNHDGAQKVFDSTFWFNRFEDSIIRLRAAITSDVWTKAAAVKFQCRSLEESVFQREEQKYYLSILQGKEPPLRPDRATLTKARNQDRPEIPEGEELLESDPESLSDDGFIEDDTSDSRSIPFEVPSITTLPVNDQAASDLELPAADFAETDTDAMSTAEPESPAAMDEPAEPIEQSSTDSDDEIRGSTRRRAIRYYSPVETVTPSRKPRPSQHVHESDTESTIDSDLDALPRLPNSKWRKVGTENEPIELMSSSPSAPEFQARHSSFGSIRTPSLNPDTASTRSSIVSGRLRLKSSVNDLGPRLDDIEAIRDLEWETIEDMVDNRRALAKAVYELEIEYAMKLQAYLQKTAEHNGRARELLKNAVLLYGEEDPVNRDQPFVHSLGLLFVTYDNSMDCMQEPALSGGLLSDTYQAVDEGSTAFFRLLDRVLKAYCDSGSLKKRTGKKRKSDEIDILDGLPDDSDILTPSDDLDQDQENVEAPGTRSAKKRKKKVLQSQEAQTQQFDDRIRIAEQELRRTAALQKMKDMVDNADGDLDEAALHPVSFDLVAPIYLDPHIGKKVKPHQENGIQFMWRELTAGKGCMLAHTMGLGKTMQVISLLITIAQASESENIDIQNQVPSGLRNSRTLILSPPSLVDNWYDEILMWTPEGSLVLGEVRKIVAATDSDTRMYNIDQWAEDGGVLLLTYPLFKQIVDKAGKKIPEELREKYAEMLTHKPNIVIADEAHHMKNPSSGLAKAAMKLTTKTRIALTGSPLSNHLEEYHQMVDWISPGYLGSIVQFRAKYSEPIKNGLYSDSSSYERKTSARKLLVLKRDLDPKICRADISAIAKDMPNKAEFFITIPLTTVQKGAYSAYAKHMLHDHADGSFKQAKIWSWLSVLSLLLNHPSAFVKKLKDHNETESESPEEEREASVATEDLSLPADVPLSSVGLTAEATKDILSAFSTMTQKELDDVHHSYRSLLTARIVKESMRINEKVLIFSHSIPTLDYLEKLLNKLHCKYARIDGKTSMPIRQGMVKDFNSEEDVEVMLISTTAGGLGLNLQGANRVILYDFNFNPTWEEQAVGRAYRLGQKKHVFVYRFRAGGTFEETVYNMAIFKTQLFARVVDKRNPMRCASKNLSDYLFPPREVEQAELDECVGKDPEVLDRIMDKETCIRKVELTETFQVEEDDELTPEELKQADQEYQDEVLARTDPAKLERLIRERERARNTAQTNQYWQVQARRVDPLSATLPSPSQRPAPAQSSQMAYARQFAEQRRTDPAGPSQVPHVQFGAYDDMELSPPRELPRGPRGRADSLPRRPPQMDGQDDRQIGCTQQ